MILVAFSVDGQLFMSLLSTYLLPSCVLATIYVAVVYIFTAELRACNYLCRCCLHIYCRVARLQLFMSLLSTYLLPSCALATIYVAVVYIFTAELHACDYLCRCCLHIYCRVTCLQLFMSLLSTYLLPSCVLVVQWRVCSLNVQISALQSLMLHRNTLQSMASGSFVLHKFTGNYRSLAHLIFNKC